MTQAASVYNHKNFFSSSLTYFQGSITTPLTEVFPHIITLVGEVGSLM
jgi:hypothetical protein